MKVLAVDWSGRRQGARRAIWLAEVIDGEVTRVEDGRDREELVEHLVALADHDPALMVGIDCSFSLPAWFVESRGHDSAPAFWDDAAAHAEAWITCADPPFWGRRGCPRPDLPAHFRVTEDAVGHVGGIRPKSTFQVSGAGSVGAGSLRGFASLARLRAHGFSIWPFDDATPPAVVEVWPRLLTGPVVKSDPRERSRYLARLIADTHDRDPAVPEWARQREVKSEDAFDALVSVLVMARHVDDLCSLVRSDDPVTRMEGATWCPRPTGGLPIRSQPSTGPSSTTEGRRGQPTNRDVGSEEGRSDLACGARR